MANTVISAYRGYLWRIVTGLVDFRGRSVRTEFLAFLILMMAIHGVAMVFAELTAAGLFFRYDQYLEAALWVFAIPIFARRLHDQNRSGWLALILPAWLGVWLFGQILSDPRHLPIARLGLPYTLANIILVSAFWVLVVLPGTAGENRFGQDPRRLRSPKPA